MDLIAELAGLKDTPVPVILVAGGVIFLLLALAGGFSGKIEIPIHRQKWAGVIGSLLLMIGIMLFLTPPSAFPAPTQVEVTQTPTPTDIPTPTNTPTPINSTTPIETSATPTVTLTQEPLSSTLTTACAIRMGQEVHTLAHARLWTQPDVTVAKVSLTLPIGDSVYVIGGPVWGRIIMAADISGWWWEVSKTPNGSSLGWIWEERIDECD